MEVNVRKCPGCGMDLEVRIDTIECSCQYCGKKFLIEKTEAEMEAQKAYHRAQMIDKGSDLVKKGLNTAVKISIVAGICGVIIAIIVIATVLSVLKKKNIISMTNQPDVELTVMADVDWEDFPEVEQQADSL